MNRVAASILVASRVFARAFTYALKAASVLMVQGALSLGLVVGMLHFIISDPICADYVSDIVSRNIPGTLRMQRIHASPLLREWSVVGVRAYTPQMQPVIQAERVDFLLQRQSFFKWLFGLMSGTPGVELHADKLKVVNGYVDVDLRDPERTPLVDTFITPEKEAAGLSKKDSPLWIDFPRVSMDRVNITVRTQTATISADQVGLDGSLNVRDESLDIRAQKIRFQRGKIGLSILPFLKDLPVSSFSSSDVSVTEQAVALGSFSARIGDVEITGRGTLGRDEEQTVDAQFRVDTTFNNPLLERLLPLRGDGLVSMVAEVNGGLFEPQIEADLYAEDSSIDDLQIRQASGHLVFGRDLAGDNVWRYGLPRFRILTQHGSLRVSEMSGQMNLGEIFEIKGKGLFRLRRLSPLALLDALGVDRGTAHVPRLQVGGPLNLSFQGGEKGWTLAPSVDLGVVVGGRRELSVKGNPKVEISGEVVRISAPDLEIADDSIRLKIEGETKWPGGEMDLSVRGEVMKLQGSVRPFADVPLKGALENLVLEISGALPVPTMHVRGNLRGVRMEGTPSARGYMDVTLRPDGVLDVDLLEAKAEGFDFATKGALHLFEPGSWDLARKMVVKLRNMRGSGDLDEQDFVPELSGQVRVWSRGLTLDLLDPIKSLHGRINLKGKYLSYGDYRLRTLELAAEGRANQLNIERLHAVLAGGAQLSVMGRIKDFRTNVDLRVKVLDLNLTRVLIMAGLSPAENPLVGFVRADMRISGAVMAPSLHGTVTGMNLRYGAVKLGRVAVGFKPLESGGAKLIGKELPTGFSLEEPSALHLQPEKRQLVLTLGFTDIDPLTLAGVTLPENLNKLQMRLQGRSRIHVNLDGAENTEPLVRIWLPEDGFSVEGEPLMEPLNNPVPIEARFADGELSLPNLQLRYGDADVQACGVVYADGFVEAALRGTVPLQVLTLQRSLFSDASGTARLRGQEKAIIPAGLLVTCTPDMLGSDFSPATIQGTFRAALVDAELHFLDGRASLRGMAQEIVLPNDAGFRLRGQIIEGDGVLDFSPLKEDGFQFQFGDGTLVLQGGLRTRNLDPESLELSLRGTGFEVASPRTFRILGSPDIRVVGKNLSSPDQRSLRAEGVVNISEGFYYRSFDAFARAVGNVFGRKMDAYSRPITETFPALKDLGLDLKVRSAAFQVASPFPFGKAELDLDVNASVRGTLGRPEVFDVVHVRPGSTIQYSIFEREFEIFEGTIEFRGDPSHPHIELAARTVTTYTEASDDTAISSRSGGMSIESEESVTITIRITGTYPELDIDFSSDRPEFDEADIQSLIFTGVPARRGGGSGDVLADSSVNLFAEDLTGLLSKLMLTPFLDSVSLGVNRLGGITAEFLTSLGRSLSVKTRVMQVGVDTRFDTGFRVQFSDRVSLEGKLKVLQEEQDQTSSYEAKLKYRIPLEE